MKGLEGYTGPYVDRVDCEHLERELPPLGGPECIKHPRLRAAADGWDCTGRHGGVVMMGPTGVGKSTAALHMLRRVLATHPRGCGARWMLAADMVEDEALVARAKLAPLLVLDDIGRDLATGKGESRLFRVLDYRYLRAPTIITTGLSPAVIKDTFSHATLRRMKEFRGTELTPISVFPVKDKSPDAVLAADRPPSDQVELARRFG